MKESAMMTRLHGVFRDVFDDAGLELQASTTAKDVPGWDSSNHVNLIIALEEAFEIQFSTDEIVAMANVGDLVTVLSRKGIDIGW